MSKGHKEKIAFAGMIHPDEPCKRMSNDSQILIDVHHPMYNFQIDMLLSIDKHPRNEIIMNCVG